MILTGIVCYVVEKKKKKKKKGVNIRGEFTAAVTAVTTRGTTVIGLLSPTVFDTRTSFSVSMGNQSSAPSIPQEQLQSRHDISDAESTEEVLTTPERVSSSMAQHHKELEQTSTVTVSEASWNICPAGLIPFSSRKASSNGTPPVIGSKNNNNNNNSNNKRKQPTDNTPLPSTLLPSNSATSSSQKKMKRSTPVKTGALESFSTPSPPPTSTPPSSGVVIDDSDDDQKFFSPINDSPVESSSSKTTATTTTMRTTPVSKASSSPKRKNRDDANQKGDSNYHEVQVGETIISQKEKKVNEEVFPSVSTVQMEPATVVTDPAEVTVVGTESDRAKEETENEYSSLTSTTKGATVDSKAPKEKSLPHVSSSVHDTTDSPPSTLAEPECSDKASNFAMNASATSLIVVDPKENPSLAPTNTKEGNFSSTPSRSLVVEKVVTTVAVSTNNNEIANSATKESIGLESVPTPMAMDGRSQLSGQSIKHQGSSIRSSIVEADRKETPEGFRSAQSLKTPDHQREGISQTKRNKKKDEGTAGRRNERSRLVSFGEGERQMHSRKRQLHSNGTEVTVRRSPSSSETTPIQGEVIDLSEEKNNGEVGPSVIRNKNGYATPHDDNLRGEASMQGGQDSSQLAHSLLENSGGKNDTVWGRKRRKKTISSSSSQQKRSIQPRPINLMNYAQKGNAEAKTAMVSSTKKTSLIRKSPENKQLPRETGTRRETVGRSEKEKRLTTDAFEFDADSETSGSRSNMLRRRTTKTLSRKIARKKKVVDGQTRYSETSTTGNGVAANVVTEYDSRNSNLHQQPVDNAELVPCVDIPPRQEEREERDSEVTGIENTAISSKEDNSQHSRVQMQQSAESVVSKQQENQKDRHEAESVASNHQKNGQDSNGADSVASKQQESKQDRQGAESVAPKQQENKQDQLSKKLKVGKRGLRSNGSVTEDDSLINVPRELAPYNHPGKTDYAIVLGSRLRNRNKKPSKHESQDIPYMNVSYQRRCKAVQGDDGRILSNGEGEPCSFCAVGMTDYCHTHRALGEESSSNEELSLEGHYLNDERRCISLTLNRTKRCSRKVSSGKSFCRSHIIHERPQEETCQPQLFSTGSGGTRCVAYFGDRCTFKAVENTVFCPSHIQLQPSKCVFVDLVSPTKNSREIKSAAEAATTPSDERLLLDVPITAQCKHTNNFGDRCCYEVFQQGFCRMHTKCVDNQVPSNEKVEDLPQVEAGKAPEGLQEACSQDFRCVFVHNKLQCRNQILPGSVLCPAHWDCRRNKSSIFDVLETEGLTLEHRPEMEPEKEGASSSVSNSQESDGSSSTDEKQSNPESDVDDDVENVETERGSDSSSSVSDSDTSITSMQSVSPNGMYTHSDFVHLWRQAENFIGQTTDEIEDSKRVRAANGRMQKSDTGGQLKAQYGRLLPSAMKKMMKILELGRDDVFLDIGHGIGNTCLHVSFCVGCESRGIEVVAGRHSIAEVFRSQLIMFNREHPENPSIGKIDLRLGQLEDPQFKDFLTVGVTRAYVNNFNGVFADRSTKTGQKYFLDDYVAGLFALMAPGSIMITFHPLSLGLDRSSANDLRTRHGMAVSDNASFFEFEKVRLGKAYKTVKWTKHSGNESSIFVYKYRRLQQKHGKNAVFLCSNPGCENAINEVPIQASTQNEEGRYVINHCACKYSAKNLRRRSGRSNGSGSPGLDAES
ncbi:histone methylation protein [Nitzschia inconspicua]|uniref:Histone methylation protein n=1 Tax=Nitzschia inconspicua TaxID=303405 RepID=A0A9K3L876_9STRA|nr:histone methylation protein [Nitzschia inconspicua]